MLDGRKEEHMSGWMSNEQTSLHQMVIVHRRDHLMQFNYFKKLVR